MQRYLVRRLFLGALVLLVVSLAVFSMVHLAPGDPVTAMLSEDIVDPQVAESLRKEMGLDRSVVIQYLSWTQRVVRGDLGYSFRARKPVTQMILERIGVTVELSVASLFLALILAVGPGVLSALRRGTILDFFTSVLAALGISMPAFWLGIILILLFALKLHWLPASGYARVGEGLGEHLHFLVLPILTLALPYAAILMRFVRTAVLDVVSEDYVRTAEAKGLPGTRVLHRHVLTNAWLPVVTVIALETGRLLGGAVLTETIFAIPGIGRLAVDAVLGRDFPVLQAVTMIMAVGLLVANLAADVLYAALDPRIRYG
jgi:peptide/nickel transport system permease protein